MHTIVLFNSVPEYLTELHINVKDQDNLSPYPHGRVTDGIVRVTKSVISSSTYPLIFIHVLVTYKCGDDIIKLDKYCGQGFEGKPSDTDLETKRSLSLADKVLKDVEKEITTLHLHMRAGVYRFADEK